MIHIKIDIQEKCLLEYLPSTSLQNWQPESLDIGDIHFYHLSQPTRPLLVIERKTLKDLASSIRDGRYKEQILRLQSIRTAPTRLAFILEGCQFKIDPETKIRIKRAKDLLDPANKSAIQYNKLQPDAIYSAYINIQMRDDIHVMETDDMSDTVHLLQKLQMQIEKKYSEIIGSNHVTANLQEVHPHNFHYSKQIKAIKKDNLNPQVCYLDQLARVPGMSIQQAAFIAEKYPTMAMLITAYQSIDLTQQFQVQTSKTKIKTFTGEEMRAAMLEDITIISENGNTRRLGPALSARIYQYLFGLMPKENII